MLLSVITLFPDMFKALTEFGISGRAIKRNIISLSTVNPRDFANDKHDTVDDRPYGGGPGMVMTFDPLKKAISSARKSHFQKNGLESKVLYMSPQGERLDQKKILDISSCENLIILCGRYEGIDERLIESEVDLEVSIGDYIISGGELAAMVMIDGVIRLLPGAVDNEDSVLQDSFGDRVLLDCPHYSRPEIIDGKSVPEVLLSGDHAKIKQWRLKQSLMRTKERRPDLFEQLELSKEELDLLNS